MTFFGHHQNLKGLQYMFAHRYPKKCLGSSFCEDFQLQSDVSEFKDSKSMNLGQVTNENTKVLHNIDVSFQLIFTPCASIGRFDKSQFPLSISS